MNRQPQNRLWILLLTPALAGCSWFGSKTTEPKEPLATAPVAKAEPELRPGSARPKAAGSATAVLSQPDRPEVAWSDRVVVRRPPDQPPGARGLGLYGEVGAPVPSPAQHGANESITQISFAVEGADAEPSVDSNGEFLVFASTQHHRSWDIYLKSAAGRTVTQLTNDPSNNLMPVFSPDNRQVAFTSDRTGWFNIYIMDVTGGSAIQVTSDTAHEIHPSWSPDGRHLVYCRLGEQSGRWELWVVETANFNVRHFIGYGLMPRWCPDPTQNLIVYQRARERGSRLFSIWTIEFVDGQGVRPTEIVSAANAAAINPAWSPDGNMIAFSTVVDPDGPANRGDRPPLADIWLVNLDGTNRIKLTDGRYANLQPTWGADGRVYFVSNRSGTENIWALGTRTAIGLARYFREATAEEIAEVETNR